jgi:hypothetical protein
MIQSDAAFFIGKTHKVCQDYAIADNAQAPFRSVWLSDGCSSSPNTDIGARLLSHGIQQRLAGFGAIGEAESAETQQMLLDTLIRKNLRFAARNAKQLGISRDFLDATLLGLVESGNGEAVDAVLYGDGAVVFGGIDGRRDVYRSQYPAGYPYYPVYVGDQGRGDSWRQVPNNRHTITRTTLLADGSVEACQTFVPDAPYHLLRQPKVNLSFAAVLSDGIESYQAKVGAETSATFKSVDYLAAVHELTAFKNFKGEFVHRRMQSFEKECLKRGWHHNDDISVAAMHFERV